MINIVLSLILFCSSLRAMGDNEVYEDIVEEVSKSYKIKVKYPDGVVKKYDKRITLKLLEILSNKSKKYTFDEVKECLEQQAYPNWPDNNGESAIFWLIKRSGDHRKITPQLFDLLLQYGADFNFSNAVRGNQTPLHFAATGYGYAAKLLLEQRVKLNERDSDGNTPLHIAAHQGKVEVAQLLVEHGAKINLRNNDGDTPLHRCFKYYSEYVMGFGFGDWVVESDKKQITMLLIEKGADLNIVSGVDNTPLRLATNRHEIKLMRTMLKHGANPNQETIPYYDLVWENFNDVTHHCDYTYLKDIVRLLFQYNARLRLPDKTVVQFVDRIKRNYDIDLEELYKQVHDEQKESFALFTNHFLNNCSQDTERIPLLERMASVHEIFCRIGYNWKFYELPLPGIMQANELLQALKSRTCTAATVQQAVADGAYLFLNHDAPLRKAIKYEAPRAVLETLIRAGADVHTIYNRSSKKYTPLHYAAACNNRDAIAVLCTYGANPNALNDRHEAPLFTCCLHPWRAILSDEEKVKRALTAIALLENKADVNYKNRSGDTPLHIVARKGENMRLATVLLKAGAQVNASNNAQQTPLHCCFYCNPNEQIIRLLANAGADITMRDERGKTAVDVAGYKMISGQDVNDQTIVSRLAIILSSK